MNYIMCYLDAGTRIRNRPEKIYLSGYHCKNFIITPERVYGLLSIDGAVCESENIIIDLCVLWQKQWNIKRHYSFVSKNKKTFKSKYQL